MVKTDTGWGALESRTLNHCNLRENMQEIVVKTPKKDAQSEWTETRSQFGIILSLEKALPSQNGYPKGLLYLLVWKLLFFSGTLSSTTTKQYLLLIPPSPTSLKASRPECRMRYLSRETFSSQTYEVIAPIILSKYLPMGHLPKLKKTEMIDSKLISWFIAQYCPCLSTIFYTHFITINPILVICWGARGLIPCEQCDS